jgi:hypothetical protein
MRHPLPGPLSGFSVRERNKIMSTDPSLIRPGAGLCLNNGSKSEYRVAKFHFRWETSAFGRMRYAAS